MKYLIMWNAGYGNAYDEVDAEDMDEAEKVAYESWRQDAESQADYWAKEMTDELREEYDFPE